MSNKIERINKRLERNEDERRELLNKLKKEQEASLLKIGSVIVKYVPYENLDIPLLEEVIKEYYVPMISMAEQETEDEQKENKKEQEL